MIFALAGTAVPEPTDFTRSPSTTTTALRVTLVPSQTLPNRSTVVTGGVGAWARGPPTAATHPHTATSVIFRATLRVVSMEPPSERVLDADLHLPRRSRVRLLDLREGARVEVGDRQVVQRRIEHIEDLELEPQSLRVATQRDLAEQREIEVVEARSLERAARRGAEAPGRSHEGARVEP